MMRYDIHFGPETLHIALEGVLGFMDAHKFHRMLYSLQDQNDNCDIHINVSRLTSIDHTGMRLLMQVHDFAKQSRRNLTFIDPKGKVLEFLKMPQITTTCITSHALDNGPISTKSPILTQHFHFTS